MPEQLGEKTEQPTARRLEEAVKQGQFPRSAEVQTVCVLLATMTALFFTGNELWHSLALSFTGMLGHLHDLSITSASLQRNLITALLYFAQCVWPVVLAAMVGGLLAGGMQSRFQTVEEALRVDWNRVNPAEGFQRVFSFNSAVPTLIAVVKLGVIIALTYSEILSVLNDPIFATTVSVASIARFLAQTAFSVVLRVGCALVVIAGADYGYQFWKTNQDLMMTKQEVKDEQKNSEGNPQMKSRMRRRRQRQSVRQQLLNVPKADVIVTNPTHLAVALRYDRQTMRAPKIVAKGSRLNAQRIREIAQQHQVPIIENKPLARMMFKYGRVGGEIPAQLYAAVAEVLAYVYRVNRYRYYTEGNQTGGGSGMT